jgi:hypothetical protein
VTSTQLLRVQCFNVSTDGFSAGEDQSLDADLTRGHGHSDATTS